MKKAIVLALAIILINIVQNSHAQVDTTSNSEIISTIDLEPGPKVEEFQLRCEDEVGAYLVYYDFEKKKVLAYDIIKNVANNFNQTIAAEFSKDKAVIKFTVQNITDFAGKNKLKMTLETKNQKLRIYSEASKKRYTLNCIENR